MMSLRCPRVSIRREGVEGENRTDGFYLFTPPHPYPFREPEAGPRPAPGSSSAWRLSATSYNSRQEAALHPQKSGRVTPSESFVEASP